MTSVLVTGGAGFIGSHTVDLLLERRVRIRGYLHRVHLTGRPAGVPEDAEFLHGDVADQAAPAPWLRRHRHPPPDAAGGGRYLAELDSTRPFHAAPHLPRDRGGDWQ